MSTREVVTLQIGNYSNFVGTHWWNLQESSFIYDPAQLAAFPKEVNHDVLFREGKTVTGQVTYTPRLVLVDLNHSLGSLRREGSLYTTPADHDSVNWLSDVTLHEAPREKRNIFLEDLEEGDESCVEVEKQESNEPDETEERKKSDIDKEGEEEECVKQEDVVFGKPLYNLDNVVNVWSDYLRTALHPKTNYILQDYQHNNPEHEFNVFGLGQQAVGSKTQRDDLEDRVRYFTEECDQLQGFQIFVDCHDGFGGVGASLLSYLADEYTSKSRFMFAVTPASLSDQTAKDRSCRIINTALSLHHGCELSSLCLPLSLASSLWKSVGKPVTMPHLDYKADLSYHTSAILASSIDTMTMPYRKETSPARISDITSSFSTWGRKVACLNSSIPFPLGVGCSFPDSLMALGESDPWVSLTPHMTSQTSPHFQSCVVRGISNSMVQRRTQKDQASSLLSTCTTVDDVIRLYLSETYPSAMNAGCVMRDGIKVGSPFPHIFSPAVNHMGFISDTQRTAASGVYSVPAMTSLQTGTDLHGHIASLHECVSKFNIKRHNHFREAGMEEDDYMEMIDGLDSLAQCYET